MNCCTPQAYLRRGSVNPLCMRACARQTRTLLLNKRDAALAELSEKLGRAIRACTKFTAGSGWPRPSTDHGITYPRTEKGNPSFTCRQYRLDAEHTHWLPPLIVTADQVQQRRRQLPAKDPSTTSSTAAFTPRSIRTAPKRRHPVVPLLLFRSAAAADAGARRGAGAADPRRVPAGRRRGLGQAGCLAAGIPLRRALRERTTSCQGRQKPSALPRRSRHRLSHLRCRDDRLEREPAKAVNFAKIFGAGVSKFAAMIGKPVTEARAIYRALRPRAAVPVPQARRALPGRAREAGYLTLYDGARRHWDDCEAGGRLAQGRRPVLPRGSRDAAAQCPSIPGIRQRYRGAAPTRR